MLDRLDADAVSLSFGGLKNTVLLPDFAVIGILHFDQKQPLGMQICSDLICRLSGAVRILASSAFSNKLDKTRHMLISSTGRVCGRSSFA